MAAVPYEKFNELWEDEPSLDTPILANALNHVEQGIFDESEVLHAMVVHPQRFGVVPSLTGLTDESAHMQDTLDYAEELSVTAKTAGYDVGSAVMLPRGVIKAASLNYRQQTIIGPGRPVSGIVGKPSEDILHLDPTLAYDAMARAHIGGFTMFIDDADPDGPDNFNMGDYARGGLIGPAGISVDCPDGSAVNPARLNNVTIHDLDIRSLSMTPGGQNGAWGIYQQFPWAQCVADSIWFYRLAGSWEDAVPDVNAAVMNIATDHNSYRHLFANECGSGFKFINLEYCDLTNMTMQSCGSAFQLVNFDSAGSDRSSFVTIRGMMVENADTICALFEGADIEGKCLAFVGTSVRPVFDTINSEWTLVHSPNVVSGAEIEIGSNGKANTFKHSVLSAPGKWLDNGEDTYAHVGRYRSDPSLPPTVEIGTPPGGETIMPWTLDIDVFSVDALNTGAWGTNTIDTGCFYNGYNLSNGNLNDEIAWDIDLAAGTYKCELMYSQDGNGGIITVAIDGTSVGTVDTYSGAPAKNIKSAIYPITVTENGKHRLSLKTASHTAPSGAYYAKLQHVRLIKV